MTLYTDIDPQLCQWMERVAALFIRSFMESG